MSAPIWFACCTLVFVVAISFYREEYTFSIGFSAILALTLADEIISAIKRRK